MWHHCLVVYWIPCWLDAIVSNVCADIWILLCPLLKIIEVEVERRDVPYLCNVWNAQVVQRLRFLYAPGASLIWMKKASSVGRANVISAEEKPWAREGFLPCKRSNPRLRWHWFPKSFQNQRELASKTVQACTTAVFRITHATCASRSLDTAISWGVIKNLNARPYNIHVHNTRKRAHNICSQEWTTIINLGLWKGLSKQESLDCNSDRVGRFGRLAGSEFVTDIAMKVKQRWPN